MAVGHRIANLRLLSGERLPLLLNSETGLPLWAPSVFVVSQLRSANLATDTLAQATRAIMVGHQALASLGVDLDARLAQGRLLDLGELDALTALVGLTQKALDQIAPRPGRRETEPRQRASVERVRMRTRPVDLQDTVAPSTKGVRLLYLRDYIEWLAKRRLLCLDHLDPVHRALAGAASEFVQQINARLPSRSSDVDAQAREGLDGETQRRVLEVVDPASPENPWKDQHVRVRNQLIFMWLAGLGMRRGELLGVKLEDINFRSAEVEIKKRAGDPEETRRYAPKAKTRGRPLALDGHLAELTRAYVLGPRRATKGASRHPFLIVANGTGEPLSLSGLNKLFVELRRKVPGLPDELCPHVLRHSWNERFSELMDERGVAPDEEEKLRKQQMGWSDRSKMSATYTRRHIRRKANKASLALQERAFRKTGEGK